MTTPRAGCRGESRRRAGPGSLKRWSPPHPGVAKKRRLRGARTRRSVPAARLLKDPAWRRSHARGSRPTADPAPRTGLPTPAPPTTASSHRGPTVLRRPRAAETTLLPLRPLALKICQQRLSYQSSLFELLALVESNIKTTSGCICTQITPLSCDLVSHKKTLITCANKETLSE